MIRDAVKRLDWSRSRDVYKAIFIAGNEPFTQGSVDYHTSCKAAIERGILVNTIFCGASDEGRQTGWSDGAVLADGRYMSIDQNQKVVEIPTPQDATIARLGVELNKTYLPFGKMGAAGQARQVSTGRQRRRGLAERAGEPVRFQGERCLLQRCLGPGRRDQERQVQARGRQDRGSSRRTCRSWTTPAARRRLTRLRKQRAEIQAKIGKLNKEREAFLAVERKKQRACRGRDLGSGDLQDDPGASGPSEFQVRVVPWTASESWSSRTTRQSGEAWSMHLALPDMPRSRRAKGPRDLPRPLSLNAT